jgi:hypothetical protein
MNVNGCGRKRSWRNLRYSPSIRMEGLRKTTNSQDSRSLGRDFNPGFPEYETELSTARHISVVVPDLGLF